jgi:exopolysaccharide biosynthesis polyprenyl glycosylphosphotransferase
MIQEKKHFIKFTITLFDITILIFTYWLAVIIRAKLPSPIREMTEWYLPYYTRIFPIFLVTFSSIIFFNNTTLQKFPVDKYNFYLRTIFSFITALAIYIVILYYFKLFNQSRVALLLFVIISIMLMILNRELISKSKKNSIKTIVLGKERDAKEIEDLFSLHDFFGIKILNVFNKVPSNFKEILEKEPIEWVIITEEKHKKYIQKFTNLGLTVSYYLKETFGNIPGFASLESSLSSPIITFHPTPPNYGQLFIKYTLDRIVAATAILLFLPIFIIIAILIKSTSKGPVIYKHPRVGLNGKIFNMLKFRTMFENADELKESLYLLNKMDKIVFKVKNDPRITKIGRFLRRFSLDELPQLFNVLKGDMSLVGPRPPLFEEIKKYEDWQRKRLSMKTGLTCLWLIRGRSDLKFEEWMKFDLEYINNWSLSLDFFILLKSIPVLISGKGAY